VIKLCKVNKTESINLNVKEGGIITQLRYCFQDLIGFIRFRFGTVVSCVNRAGDIVFINLVTPFWSNYMSEEECDIASYSLNTLRRLVDRS
jgi:hypothetical protein